MDQSKPPLVAIGDDDAASSRSQGHLLNAQGFETARQERLCAAGPASSYRHDDVQARNVILERRNRTAAPPFSRSDSTVTAKAIISSIPNP
jgi:hypothetical protein